MCTDIISLCAQKYSPCNTVTGERKFPIANSLAPRKLKEDLELQVHFGDCYLMYISRNNPHINATWLHWW